MLLVRHNWGLLALLNALERSTIVGRPTFMGIADDLLHILHDGALPVVPPFGDQTLSIEAVRANDDERTRAKEEYFIRRILQE